MRPWRFKSSLPDQERKENLTNSSSSTNTTNVGFGLSLSSILTIIFVIAKLTGHFAYSWWLVFAPTIVVAGFFFLFLGVAFLIAVITLIFALKR